MFAAIQRSATLPVYQSSRALQHAERATSFQAPATHNLQVSRPENFGHIMWLELLRRLRANKVPTNPTLIPLQHGFFRFDDASDRQAYIWNRIINMPMTVSAEEIQEALPLQLANALDAPAQDGSFGFYMRSFPLQVQQLEDILAHWDECELVFQEASDWRAAMRRLGSDHFVHIRYIGVFGPTSTALSRFESDISQRSSGVLAAFLRSLATIMPEVLDAAKVFVFKTATIHPLVPGEVVSQALIDERERLLIAAFDLQSLLNRQTGGFFSAYEPRAEDAEVFAGLNTQVLTRGLLELRSPDPTMMKELGLLIDDILDFMDDHPVLTGTSRAAPGPGFKDVMLAQALPSTISGHVLLAVLGKDITLEDFLQPRPFLKKEGSRAGDLLLQLIQILQRWELGIGPGELSTGTNLTAFFPFFDLIPWPRHDFCVALLDFLGRYLRAIKPLVTLSCSRLTSSVLNAHLAHEHGLPVTDFLAHVGVPRLCSFMDAEEFANQPPTVEAREPETFTIMVPALDPGRDKYGKQPESLRQVMLFTLQVAIALADLSRTTIRTATSRADAMERALLVWRTAPQYVALAAALDRAKDRLRQDWLLLNVAARTRDITEQERDRRSMQAQTRAKAFVAQGQPGSQERQTQVLALWRYNWPDLHIHLTRADREAWFSWARGLGEGKSYYASALAKSSGHGLGRLLQQLAPGQDHADPQVRQQVIELAVARLRWGWSSDHFSTEKQAERARQRLGWRKMGAPITRIKDLQVSVMRGGIIRLPMKAGDATIVDVQIRAPAASVPADKKDSRTLSATEDGIGLFDQDGRMFKHNATDTVTWAKNFFPQLKHGSLLAQAWERTMGRPFQDVQTQPLQSSPLVLPAAFYGAKDHKAGIRIKRTLRTTAPEPNEADWIMWLWLQDLFGSDSGRIFLCNEEQEPDWVTRLADDVKMVRSTLKAFISRPEYVHYPWRAEWQALLDTGSSAHVSQKIKATLRALRNFTEQRKSESIRLQPNARLSINGQLLSLEAAPTWDIAEAGPAEDEDEDEDEDDGDI